jgi:hypothetical protein
LPIVGLRRGPAAFARSPWRDRAGEAVVGVKEWVRRRHPQRDSAATMRSARRASAAMDAGAFAKR